MDAVYKEFVESLQTYHVGEMLAFVAFVLVMTIGCKIISYFS